MRILTTTGVIAMVAVSLSQASGGDGTRAELYPAVKKFVDARAGEFDQIPAERKQFLRKTPSTFRAIRRQASRRD